MSYIYRGVHAKHPALHEARRGVVRPANPESFISADQHNFGFVSVISPYTSWTHDLQRALWHCNKSGPGGVLLRVPSGAPARDETWSWVYSRDRWFEAEVLMQGVRLNVEVVKV